MSKLAGKCAFCGERRSLSKGHIWPEWAGKMLPGGETHHNVIIGRFEAFKAKAPGPVFSHKIKPGRASSRRPRNTCEACNSGWMSRTETAAKPALIPLLEGRSTVLDTLNQRLLASFLCLVSVRAEKSSQ